MLKKQIWSEAQEAVEGKKHNPKPWETRVVLGCAEDSIYFGMFTLLNSLHQNGPVKS